MTELAALGKEYTLQREAAFDTAFELVKSERQTSYTQLQPMQLNEGGFFPSKEEVEIAAQAASEKATAPTQPALHEEPTWQNPQLATSGIQEQVVQSETSETSLTAATSPVAISPATPARNINTKLIAGAVLGVGAISAFFILK